MTTPKFSDELEQWLHGRQPKTIASLNEVFGERSFALAFLLLMAIPALPLPTGGLTHIFELIVLLLALELLAGRHTLWLPKRWQHISIDSLARGKALHRFIGLIRWLERYSRPRLSQLLGLAWFRRVVAIVVVIFTLSAFVAPPFSGLDTLPALGVVLMALALLLEDIILLIAGMAAGIAGIGLIIGVGAALTTSVRHFL